jgi:hypothetical protein
MQRRYLAREGMVASGEVYEAAFAENTLLDYGNSAAVIDALGDLNQFWNPVVNLERRPGLAEQEIQPVALVQGLAHGYREEPKPWL